MRKFVQALIVVIGVAATIAAVKAEQSKPKVPSCYEIRAPSAPTVCK